MEDPIIFPLFNLPEDIIAVLFLMTPAVAIWICISFLIKGIRRFLKCSNA